eukprot:gnl/TRDRNA2_/TRDRNA2_173354_c1_seq1.p1 gnl/TRDRNA2_/TRDRNA2_173354_c1~~gnl/TRDRNA2_/TRDRNA2_173354_c1_seq1.p1  ORF type:complete len:401 (+),score=28.65 gnl/TRDRNA2_/TRDRNA2_173354_c1_seq1:127-1203(+)
MGKPKDDEDNRVVLTQSGCDVESNRPWFKISDPHQRATGTKLSVRGSTVHITVGHYETAVAAVQVESIDGQLQYSLKWAGRTDSGIPYHLHLVRWQPDEHLIDLSPDFGRLTVDISKCKPPTYPTAVQECHSEPPPPAVPQVQDWLTVETNNVESQLLRPNESWATQFTWAAQEKCCTVHMGDSVCSASGTQWNPQKAWNGHPANYFNKTFCDDQQMPLYHSCNEPVTIRYDDTHVRAYRDHCYHACGGDHHLLQQRVDEHCGKEIASNESLKQDNATHQSKLGSMSKKYLALERWVRLNSPYVTEMKSVIECVHWDGDERVQLVPGYSRGPLHAECREHGCGPNQCLQKTVPCRDRY